MSRDAANDRSFPLPQGWPGHHLPPEPCESPTDPPPKPSDAHRSVTAATAPIDDQITALTQEWMELVGRDVHKDRDCHFYIEKRWSYGNEPIYIASHQGYVWDEVIDETFPTYRSAAQFLINKLCEMVAAEKEA